MDHLLSLTCSCWFCQAEIVTTKGYRDLQLAKHFTFMTSLNGTIAWYLLNHHWGNGGSEREVELGSRGWTERQDTLRPENTWSGLHCMQSCFILKRRVWSPWDWCKSQSLLPVAPRRGCEIPNSPLSSPSPPHQYPTLSDKGRSSLLWGQLSLRLMEEGALDGGDGIWLFILPHNRLLKADTGREKGRPWVAGGSKALLSFLW